MRSREGRARRRRRIRRMVSLFFFGRRGKGDDCGFVELTFLLYCRNEKGTEEEALGLRRWKKREILPTVGCWEWMYRWIGLQEHGVCFGGEKGWKCAAVLSEKIMGQTANGFFALGRSALHALQLACGVSAQCLQEAPHCWARQRSIEYSYQEIERARLERF